MCSLLPVAAMLLACGSPPAARSDAGSRTTRGNNIDTAAPRPNVEQQTPRESTMILSVVSAEPADALDRYTPLARFLARAAGYSHGRVRAVTTAGVALNDLCGGDSDLLLDTAFVAALALRACEASLVLVAAKNDSLRYESVIFVRRGSSIDSLQELRGEIILFEDDTSTSAYALPRAMLEHAGVPVVAADQARGDAVSYVFVEHELNIVGGVVHGRAAAGALSSDDIAEYEGAEITPLAHTEPIPRQLVLASPRLAAEVVENIHSAGITAHTTADAAPILSRARIGRFDRVSARDAAHIARIATFAAPES